MEMVKWVKQFRHDLTDETRLSGAKGLDILFSEENRELGQVSDEMLVAARHSAVGGERPGNRDRPRHLCRQRRKTSASHESSPRGDALDGRCDRYLYGRGFAKPGMCGGGVGIGRARNNSAGHPRRGLVCAWSP